MYYSDLTAEAIEQALKELFERKSNSNAFTIICGERSAKIFDITFKEECGIINNEEAVLERYAVSKDAYIYSGWNYLSLPQEYFTSLYYGSFTNEIFEEGEEDIYGDYELIYIGRK